MIPYMLKYDEPLFRPPSEWRSLILQVTIGCSWNRCHFCEMYKTKQFRSRPIEELKKEIRQIKSMAGSVNRIFLADGNAMVLSTVKLVEILTCIRAEFPQLRRISAYALPSDILSKSEAELKTLKELGLDLIYVGIESGDNELLRLVNKGESFDSTIKGLQMAHHAGIKSSVMILNGLGGEKFSRNHAIASADAVNRIQPAYLSTLVLSYPYGVARYRDQFPDDFIEMDPIALLRELHLFIENLALDRTVFRSDHASNYLSLKGVLGRDKQSLLDQINSALTNPSQAGLREEWQRGL